MSDITGPGWSCGSAVGRRLRALRERRRLTLEQVAMLAGLSRDMVHQAESVVLEPRWSKVVKIARALEVSLDQIAAPTEEITDPDLVKAMEMAGIQ